MPVPGPTRMQGKLGSGGSRKEGALAMTQPVRPPFAAPAPLSYQSLAGVERGGLGFC